MMIRQEASITFQYWEKMPYVITIWVIFLPKRYRRVDTIILAITNTINLRRFELESIHLQHKEVIFQSKSLILVAQQEPHFLYKQVADEKIRTKLSSILSCKDIS